MVIVRGSASRADYVALTYVWGEDTLKQEKPPGWEMPRTLSAAVYIDEYGIETAQLPEELPLTVRDAIEVTRSLGYRYLWVDSLCIIQDDREDQNFQLGMMDEIYSNATLTIAAGSGLRKSIELFDFLR
jgi:Heterokaryon incompatibility protein (HET)